MGPTLGQCKYIWISQGLQDRCKAARLTTYRCSSAFIFVSGIRSEHSSPSWSALAGLNKNTVERQTRNAASDWSLKKVQCQACLCSRHCTGGVSKLALKVSQGLSPSDCRIALCSAVLELGCSLVHFAAHSYWLWNLIQTTLHLSIPYDFSFM